MKRNNNDLEKKINEIDEKLNIIMHAVERIEKINNENKNRITGAAEFVAHKTDIEMLKKEKERLHREEEDIADQLRCKEEMIRNSARVMHTGSWS